MNTGKKPAWSDECASNSAEAQTDRQMDRYLMYPCGHDWQLPALFQQSKLVEVVKVIGNAFFTHFRPVHANQSSF